MFSTIYAGCTKSSVDKTFAFNSLWPSDAIRRQGTELTLAQVMACCLTVPSHYLNLCWLIINKVLWHSSDGIIMRISEDTNQNKIENYIFRITRRSPRGQWVKNYKHCWLVGKVLDLGEAITQPQQTKGQQNSTHSWRDIRHVYRLLPTIDVKNYSSS